MAANTSKLDYLNEMRKYFEINGKTKDFIAHNSKVHSVSWSCDGRKLASGSFDRTASVFLLDKDRLTPDNKYKGHNESVDQLCWHPTNPDLFVTASGDKTIRIWDTRSTRCAHVVNTKGENINICWSPDENTIAVGNKDDLITFVDAKSFKARHDEQFKFEDDLITFVDAKSFKARHDEQFKFESGFRMSGTPLPHGYSTVTGPGLHNFGEPMGH
ncbi:THO complex subunit 3 [Exaiptasia diaphana]|nr:THO complex subunit 3 [Exaiptasia diaphana]